MILPTSPAPSAIVDHIAAQGRRVLQPLPEGGNLVWHAWGTGSPVVLLHGGHGSWTHWIRNIEPLAAQHTVWAVDLPGLGDSDVVPGATDADGIWPAVADGISSLVSPDGAHLVGFSFGSMVAGFIAAEHPELARSLTLVGAPAMFERHTPPEGLVSVRRLTDPAEILAGHRQNLKVLMLHADTAVDDLAVYLQSQNVPRDRLASRKLAHTTLMQTLHHRWQCPVQGIWGCHDVLYDDDQLAQLPAILANCDLRHVHVVDNAGHWVQYEAPERFNRYTLAFLEEVG